MKREIALVVFQEKTNPRISVRLGDRGAALAYVVLYRSLLKEMLPKFLEALKTEGPVSKLAAVTKNWGDMAYVQANIAEALSLGKAKPDFAKVLEGFHKATENRDQDQYTLNEFRNAKYKIYKIRLSSRLNPGPKEDIALVDILDQNIGLVVAEIVADKSNVSKKGITAFQKISGEKEKETSRAVSKPKLVTFQGKKGYWITVRSGRKVFIEADKFKGYQNWVKFSQIGKRMTAAGLSSIGLGVISGMVGASLLTKSMKKAMGQLAAGYAMPLNPAARKLLQERVKAVLRKDVSLKIGRILSKVAHHLGKTGWLLGITGVGLWAASSLMANITLTAAYHRNRPKKKKIRR